MNWRMQCECGPVTRDMCVSLFRFKGSFYSFHILSFFFFLYCTCTDHTYSSGVLCMQFLISCLTVCCLIHRINIILHVSKWIANTLHPIWCPCKYHYLWFYCSKHTTQHWLLIVVGRCAVCLCSLLNPILLTCTAPSDPAHNSIVPFQRVFFLL